MNTTVLAGRGNAIKKDFFRIMGALLLGLAVFSSHAEAQGVRVVLDKITQIDSTDPWPGGEDELYFVLGGASTNGPVSNPSIEPPNDDHWSLGGGQSLTSIVLYEGYLGRNDRGFYAFIVRDRDDNGFAIYKSLFETAVGVLQLIFLSPGGIQQTVVGAIDFVNAVTADQNDTVGAFAFSVSRTNGFLQTQIDSVKDAQVMYRPTPNSVHMKLYGDGADYEIDVHVESFAGAPIKSRTTELCMDVPGGSFVDGVQVQQYTCHGGANQRWLVMRTTPSAPNKGHLTIVSENSGKCLDIRGASTSNGAAVQQYGCHGGLSQQFDLRKWTVFPFNTQVMNVFTTKCIDVPNASTLSGISLQQFTCGGTTSIPWNQFWVIP